LSLLVAVAAADYIMVLIFHIQTAVVVAAPAVFVLEMLI